MKINHFSKVWSLKKASLQWNSTNRNKQTKNLFDHLLLDSLRKRFSHNPLIGVFCAFCEFSSISAITRHFTTFNKTRFPRNSCQNIATFVQKLKNPSFNKIPPRAESHIEKTGLQRNSTTSNKQTKILFEK